MFKILKLDFNLIYDLRRQKLFGQHVYNYSLRNNQQSSNIMMVSE